MSVELGTQIRDYVQQVDADQQPLTPDEIMALRTDRDAVQPVRPRQPRSPLRPVRGVWVAVVAATLTILLIGVVAWLVRSDSQVAPADTLPAPTNVETTSSATYFAPVGVPDSFVLQEVAFDPFRGNSSHVTYRRDIAEAVWLPSDGGFAVDSRSGLLDSVFGEAAPADPVEAANEHLDAVLDAVSEATELQIAGQRAVLVETMFNQADVATTHISLLVHDGNGGLFEITAFGMTRGDAIAIAENVTRVSVADLRSVALTVPRTHRAVVNHVSFRYPVPQVVHDVSSDFTVALGVDLLTPRLFDAVLLGADAPGFDEPGQSNLGYILLTARDDLREGQAHSALEQDPTISRVFRSLALAQRHLEQFIDHARGGSVLSEEPFIVQAPPGPPPQFDTTGLGQQIPLAPATTADVVPEFLIEQDDPQRPAATQAQPIVIVGTAQPADTLAGQPSIVVWITQSGDVCDATVHGTTAGSGCGTGAGGYGVTGETSGGANSITYVVPPDTAVVQILTPDSTYWQQPIAGYGLIPYGNTVKRPTQIIAFGVDGTELGQWDVFQS